MAVDEWSCDYFHVGSHYVMAKKAQAVESRFGLPLSVASILDSVIGISLLLLSWADARRFLTDPTPKPDTTSFAPLYQPLANVSRQR